MNIWRRLRAAGAIMRQGSIPLDVVDVKSYSKTDGFKDAKTPSRIEAEGYAAFARCIDLITKAGAEMAAGTIRVVDEDGKVINTPRAKAALRLLRYSPDGVHTGAEFLRDLLGDYLIWGNGLVHVVMSADGAYGTPIRLDRLAASSATTQLGDKDLGLSQLVYRATPFGFNREEVYPARRVAHAKFFPRDAVYNSRSGRTFFAPAPIRMLSRSLSIGKRGDAWVDSFFDEGARNDLAITMPAESAGTEFEERNIEAYEFHQTDKRSPLWLYGGAQARNLNPTPQGADALELRRYGVEDVSRFYGVPVPLINLHQSQWGSGIEQLARLFYRYCVRLHLNSVLDSLSFRLLREEHRFEIDPTQEVKGDLAAVTSFVGAMRPSTNTPGVMSQDEVRDYLGIRGKYVNDWGFDPVGSGQGEPESGDQNGRGIVTG